MKIRNWFPVVVLLALAGCATPTQITGTWRNPETIGKTYNQIVVAALSENEEARKTLEENLQKQLQQLGVTATKSSDMFSSEVMRSSATNPTEFLNRITATRHDAILTVTVIDTEVENRYVRGPNPYSPVARFKWYDSFRGYYGYMSPYAYNAEYYRQDKIYFLEMNLYDAQTEKLIWSAQSEAYNPADLELFAKSVAEMTVSQMRKDGLIK